MRNPSLYLLDIPWGSNMILILSYGVIIITNYNYYEIEPMAAGEFVWAMK